MELATAPPTRVAAGVQFGTPIVVTFSAPSTSSDKEVDEEKGRPLPDLSGLWAFLSLTTADKSVSVAPPRTDLLRGRKADSIHPIHLVQHGNRPVIAYASFPGIAITQPGSYRIKVDIIDMAASFTGGSMLRAAVVLPCLYSKAFNVVDANEHSGTDPRLAETIPRLRSLGINC